MKINEDNGIRLRVAGNLIEDKSELFPFSKETCTLINKCIKDTLDRLKIVGKEI